MKNKLMDIYDDRYDEIFNKLILKFTDREVAKKVIGQIFNDTWSTLTVKNTTKDSIEIVFSHILVRYGIS